MKAYIVDQSALKNNIEIIQEKAGNAAIYAVIKGNGYGLGLIPYARILWECGIRRFAVTEPEDAQALRDAGFHSAVILMLRETAIPEELRLIRKAGAIPVCGCTETVHAMQTLAKEEGPVSCHISIDVGMGRYGFRPEETEQLASLYQDPALQIEGIYTHFPLAFYDDELTKKEFASFCTVIDSLTEKGFPVGERHCCNSSAFLKFPEMHLDAVRIGSAFLGRLSMPGYSELQAVGWCESQIEVLRTIPKGQSVGYGCAWTAPRDTLCAVTGVGYFNGFGMVSGDDTFRFRDCARGALSYGKAFLRKKAVYALVNSQKAKVLGHIGMVQTILDVTDIPCNIGDPIRMEIGPLRQKNLPIVYR